jgi:hypothetical protein
MVTVRSAAPPLAAIMLVAMITRKLFQKRIIRRVVTGSRFVFLRFKQATNVGLAAVHTGIGQGKAVSMLTRRPVRADSWQAFITSSTCKPCSGVINVGLPVKSASAT